MAVATPGQPESTGPSWDETIVPALRKRLQGESRTLSKRMSVVSIESNREETTFPDHLPAESPPYTSIPRPSIHNGRPLEIRAKTPSIKQRARTQSTPFVYEPSATPMGRTPEAKPTRIPTRTRAASINSRAESRNGYTPQPVPTHDLWAVNETSSSVHSHSTVDIPQHKRSGLLNEPTPAEFNHVQSAVDDYDPPRQSTESEERPFEHRYRGESTRNGGVGELRVGRRAEMLEIANYGHTVRRLEAANRTQTETQWNGTAMAKQGSFYMDDEQQARVLDENPLTDIEADDASIDSYYNISNGLSTTNHNTAVEPPPPVPQQNESLNGHRSNNPPAPSRIPGPSQRSQTPTMRAQTPTLSRTTTPTPQAIQRGVSESLSNSTSTLPRPHTAPKLAASSSTPTEVRNAAAAARRAKSPASTASKKANAAKLEAKRELQNRRSIAQYPAPADGVDMEHAIPSWTQAVPQNGNWDNVVLPTVARKKGLDGQYEVADGSPKPKKAERIPPAPGTFGYDWSKYRPPRDTTNQDISLDEFGRQGGAVRHSLESTKVDREPELEKKRQGPPSPSPVPFAHYAPNKSNSQPLQQMRPSADNGEPQSTMQQRQGEKEDEDGGAGCCKCVIM